MWTRSEPAQAARPDKERFAISTDPVAAALARAVAAARIEGTAARAADTDLPGTAGLEAGIAGPVVGTVRSGIAAEGIAIGSVLLRRGILSLIRILLRRILSLIRIL